MKKSNQVNVKNVPPDLLRKAQIKAIQEGKSLSEVLRELLKDWTQKQPAK